MKTPVSLCAVFAAALMAGSALADVKLPAIISNHMVLKKAAAVPIWGKADPGEKIAVTLGDQTASTETNAQGSWRVNLNLQEAKPGPFGLVVEGKNRVAVSDVVVGEVWVASGQSNMEMLLKSTIGANEEIAHSASPMLRQFLVARSASETPLDDCKGSWVIAGPETSGDFSAVGYYFAKTLQKELNVPVGLIHTSWGGTPSEAWTSQAGIAAKPELQEGANKRAESFKKFPALKEKFAEEFEAWLEKNNRSDKPTADVAAFAGPDVPADGWTPVKLPGEVSAEGLPANGAIWLRREVNLPVVVPGESLRIDVGAAEGFERIYWNGKLVGETTCKDFPGRGYSRRYEVPASLLKQGRNVLAIRMFAPVSKPKFPVEPKAGGISLKGEWLAKSEFALPSLDQAALAGVPAAPAVASRPQDMASYLFNGMINPILPYAITGVIWYQGEANAGRAWQYRSSLPLLIEDWRAHWNQGVFPFYFCQLANYMDKKTEPGESAWAELRDAQSSTLSLPQTGQAVLIDIGESGDIHPRNKKDVGERLAAIALANDYGKKVPFSGPTLKKAGVEGGKMRLFFDHADGGLAAKPLPATYDVRSKANQTAPLVRNTPDSELEGFAICGSDKKWVWANASIDKDSVLVWSDKVPQPVAVRYAWADNPTCNLYNGAGFPASPFRTDDFPAQTQNSTY